MNQEEEKFMSELESAKVLLNRHFQLGAEEDVEDWEIELADHDKLSEFIVYMAKSEEDQSPLKYALMSLILASYDQYLFFKKDAGSHLWNQIETLIKNDYSLYFNILGYWELPEEDDQDNWFHITPLIRSIRFK